MNYNEELEIILKWRMNKIDEFDELSNRVDAIIRHGALDSPLDTIQLDDFQQYKLRLLELREKYGKTSEEDIKELERMRALTAYREEMGSLCDWYKQKVLEHLEAVEKGEITRQGYAFGEITPEDGELIRLERMLNKKYGIE